MKILRDPGELHRVIKEELQEDKQQFADARRTVIMDSQQDLTHADLITEEDLVVTLSHEGYIKSQSLDVYCAQRRGGRGKMATRVKESDFVKSMLVAPSHDYYFMFLNVW